MNRLQGELYGKKKNQRARREESGMGFDFDFREPAVHRLKPIKNQPGFSSGSALKMF